MKMNYGKWFYNQHKYRKNSRDGNENFTDTKWININDRYQKLIEAHSGLLSEQHFIVQGNDTGFEKLIDLMGRSNYTFEDIDDALGETYEMSLQNTMSRNLVNTHCVIFATSNLDQRNTQSEKFTHYRIIDAPWNQLHFGHRDEFIRQKISQMHETYGDYHADVMAFNSSEFNDILGFSIMCTVNGRICNDVKIAIDDKGFRFKVGWPYASDVDFIVYKLDNCKVFSVEVNPYNIRNNTLTYSMLGINNSYVKGMKCILNIHDKRFEKTVATVPNFGIFNDTGLFISNLQKETVSMFERQNSTSVTLDIYAIKFLHEVPNIYPAVNYYDIMETRGIYNERYEKIKTPEGYRVVATNTNNINYLETCTPPICLDRSTKNSFKIVIKCLSIYDDMMQYSQNVSDIGQGILYGSQVDFDTKWKPLASKVYSNLKDIYVTYQQGAIITSLVKPDDIELFYDLLEKFRKFISTTKVEDVQSFEFSELYGGNYTATVTKISSPFTDNALSPFSMLGKLQSNYFDDDNTKRFNRPISEECFITLRYHQDEDCWLFDHPTIKRFHGIGNTFYIDSELKGHEMYKFFVLYSDTEAPSELEIEHFDEKTVFDFDLFCNEVEKHLGCIRYFDAENRLLKMSRMLYNDYSDETCVQVLSKILKRKLEGDSLLKIYPSDINYEESNKTTDNFENYTLNSERGPFTLNFMFYTLSMLNNNEDRLQAYFYRQLTQNKFSRRYADINITELLSNERYPMKYSQFTISPSRPSDTHTVKPSGQPYAFYGLPFILNSNGSNMYEPYRYVLNVYTPDVKWPLISDNSVDNNYYTNYEEGITSYAGEVVMYSDDIHLGMLITKYLCSVYDIISELQTNYKTPTIQTGLLQSAIKTITEHINLIDKFTKTANYVDVTGVVVYVKNMALSIIHDNPFLIELQHIASLIDPLLKINFVGTKIEFLTFINNNVLGTLKKVYKNTGLDNNVLKRARMLYIYLKKINKPMNPYMFKKWLNDIDLDFLDGLDENVAHNDNYDLYEHTFSQFASTLRQYIELANTKLDELDFAIKNIHITIGDHLRTLISYCNAVCNSLIFDIFTLDHVDFDNTIQYNDQPGYVIVKLTNDSHSVPPIGTKITGTHHLVFQPIIDKVNNKYVIRSIANICEYAFFNGEKITGAEMYVISTTGSPIGVQNVDLTFMYTSSTSDRMNTFTQLINSGATELEFENGHESFEVVNGLIVNEKHADMNYEMLVGNHFVQLDHDIEYVLKPQTWIQGSIDKVYIDNQVLNRMTIADFAHHDCNDVYFKPVQVLHIELDNSVLQSVNGKYFVGQTIYLKTTDGLTYFPVKITAIDHGMNKGFIEAEVDSWNAKWFKITDPTTITNYLSNNIECEVIDDNIRNFMDEFSDETLPYYNNPGIGMDIVYDENFDSCYKLPGDPIFVSSNANYVYSRLNWFFSELVENRFVDEAHKTRRFMYVSSGFINDEHDTLRINMINHDFNGMTLPEKYPILKDAPNDHEIWAKEIETYEKMRLSTWNSMQSTDKELQQAYIAYHNAKTIREKENILARIESMELRQDYRQKLIDRLQSYIDQQEKPTTWFNVRSFDFTSVYISNGRADAYSPRFVSNIRDMVYVDGMEVFLYDWEHKQWLDPSTYTVTKQIVDGIQLDEYDDYKTNEVLYSITITPTENFVYSKKLLVYFSYDKSDIFDDIEMNPLTCYVKFKPLLSLDSEMDNYDPYTNIKIRKHFDGYEKYKVNSDDIHIKRVKRSGKYTLSPPFRVRDLIIEDSNGTHTHEDIDKFLIPNIFKFADTSRMFHYPSFYTEIKSPIDSFVPGTEVRLIAISNNENSDYDGNISSVMFGGITSYDENDNQVITITKSTLPNYKQGTYICTVFQTDEYDPVGGVIQIRVTSTREDIYDTEWVPVPKEYLYFREIPMEFKIIMKEPVEGETTVTLSNKYIKSSDDTITLTNENDNPYEYYYDYTNLIRYPISDTRINSIKQRFVIDQTQNPSVNVVKAPYIGICRYSLNQIPKDGLIDMTGYLPTPLTRDRYEFWVNGRCVSDTNDLIILSPTSIQLCNMKSLKNFECIELVDDINTDNDLFREGSLYVDINGNTYSNYRLALLSNSRIRNQDIKFVFNANIHNSISDYTNNIIKAPNNVDVEDDILSYVTLNDNIMDYNKLYNIPSINGITIFHPKLQGLGISEIPNKKIIELFDKVWMLERTTNPIFGMTHKEGSGVDDDTSLKLHIKQLTEPHWNDVQIDTTGMFLIYATGPVEEYFSLYISNTSDGVIDDTTNTTKIIPFIMPGVYILLDKKYQGMWLHSTFGNTKPIHIVNMTPEE